MGSGRSGPAGAVGGKPLVAHGVPADPECHQSRLTGGGQHRARDFAREAWWYMTFPGLALSLTVLGFNLLGDGLRDFLDPRLRGRL